MGIVDIFRFLVDHTRYPVPEWLSDEMRTGDPAAAISRAAQSGRCEVCDQTLDLFVHLYGRESGNHALKVMATGGVYLGGGIAPKILQRLAGPAFLHGFVGKGRMEPLMRNMPVKVILNDRAALYGAALAAAQSPGR
jgi:glucokinase